MSNEEANLLLSQQVFAYEEPSAAEEAMAAGHEGLACGSGTSTEADGETTEFELAEVEVPEGLAEEAFAFEGTVTTGGQTVDATFVALRQGSAISTMTFISAPDSHGSPDRADPRDRGRQARRGRLSRALRPPSSGCRP